MSNSNEVKRKELVKLFNDCTNKMNGILFNLLANAKLNLFKLISSIEMLLRRISLFIFEEKKRFPKNQNITV